jgi:ribosomal protein S12 methylthiotransferase accessory factor
MFGPSLRPWYASRFTGLFSRCGPIPARPHDPAVCVWAGTLPHWKPEGGDLATGGAGWDPETAEAAGVGEAVERWLPCPLPQDQWVESSFADWSLDEPALGPDQWVPFHREQYSQREFPFAPWTKDTVRHWVCCREVGSGTAAWMPVEHVFLASRPGERPGFGPSLSTGLSCGRSGDPVLLRGLQEVIERDGLMGAWWGSYTLEEHEPAAVWRHLLPAQPARLVRPNLTYRFYRVATPNSAHVTIVTLAGEDREGYCFSVGSACRETRAASWTKAILEAVQGRQYVRHLRSQLQAPVTVPSDFAGHAVYYSFHPDRLGQTALARAKRVGAPFDEKAVEGLAALMERLGPTRRAYFRDLTPPPLRAAQLDYQVLRVMAPGLQPLHGHHHLPYLGGPLWHPRGVADYAAAPPHPFP